MEVGVLGLGAVGTSLLYRFVQGLGRATAIVRRRSLGRVSRGLELVDVDGSRHRFSPTRIVVFEDLCEEAVEGLEAVFVCTKAYDLVEALERLRRASERLCIATLQNGFDPHGEALKVFGPRAVHVVTTIAAARIGDSAVRVSSWGRFFVGSRLGATGCVEVVAEVLRRASLEVEIVKNIDEWIWRKLAVNACINPLTALLRVRNGALRMEPLYGLCRAIVEEVAEVAKRLGVDVGNVVDDLDRVLESTANNVSSMLQDVLAGRRTEIDWINGAVARLGKRVGVPTPLNEAMWRLVKALEVLGGGEHGLQ